MQKNELKRITQRLLNIELELENIDINLTENDISSDYEKLEELENIKKNLEREYFELIEKQEKIDKLLSK